MTITSGVITITKDQGNLIGISIGGGAPHCPCLYIVQVLYRCLVRRRFLALVTVRVMSRLFSEGYKIGVIPKAKEILFVMNLKFKQKWYSRPLIV